MKRSKIFLGITTAILTIGGLGAGKHYGSAVTRFYCTIGGNYCLSRQETCIKQSNISCDYVTISGMRFPQYTKGPKGPWNGTNCTTQLFWDGAHR